MPSWRGAWAQGQLCTADQRTTPHTGLQTTRFDATFALQRRRWSLLRAFTSHFATAATDVTGHECSGIAYSAGKTCRHYG